MKKNNFREFKSYIYIYINYLKYLELEKEKDIQKNEKLE